MFTTELVSSVQSRLAALGYYRLRIDGVSGPGTENAMADFKRAHGLVARPYPGPITLGLLFGPDAKSRPEPEARDGEPKWLTEARRLLGTREVPGAGNNPEIMSWAEDLDQWYPGDDVAWCGLFVAHCMSVGAPNEPQDFNRLGARQWLNYGVTPKEANPPLGSICVLWRTHPTKSWNGHVFLVTGQSDNAIRGIGGNQSDAVTETWFARDRVLGIRVPAGYVGDPAPRAKTGTLSTNEA